MHSQREFLKLFNIAGMQVGVESTMSRPPVILPESNGKSLLRKMPTSPSLQRELFTLAQPVEGCSRWIQNQGRSAGLTRGRLARFWQGLCPMGWCILVQVTRVFMRWTQQTENWFGRSKLMARSGHTLL